MARTMIRLLALLLLPSLALAQAPRPGPTVRAVTAASDTILNTDCGNIVQFNRGTAVAVTLPQAGSNGNFNPRCQIQFVNIGAGNATITPTTSQIDGRASVVLQQGGGLVVTSSGGQWVSGGIYPALSTTGIVDSDQLPTATDTVKGGIIAGTCITMGGTGNKTASVSDNCRTGGWSYVIDGGGSAITTSTCSFTAGELCTLTVPYGCTLTRVGLNGDGQTGSAVVEVAAISKATFDGGTLPTAGNKITASAPPTISSGKASSDTTLTGWTKALTANTVLAFAITSSSTFKRLEIPMTCLKS